jgi:hypothetical protein
MGQIDEQAGAVSSRRSATIAPMHTPQPAKSSVDARGPRRALVRYRKDDIMRVAGVLVSSSPAFCCSAEGRCDAMDSGSRFRFKCLARGRLRGQRAAKGSSNTGCGRSSFGFAQQRQPTSARCTGPVHRWLHIDMSSTVHATQQCLPNSAKRTSRSSVLIVPGGTPSTWYRLSSASQLTRLKTASKNKRSSVLTYPSRVRSAGHTREGHSSASSTVQAVDASESKSALPAAQAAHAVAARGE